MALRKAEAAVIERERERERASGSKIYITLALQRINYSITCSGRELYVKQPRVIRLKNRPSLSTGVATRVERRRRRCLIRAFKRRGLWWKNARGRDYKHSIYVISRGRIHLGDYFARRLLFPER